MNILFVVKDIDIEHLGIMTLSSILKQAGHHIEVIESNYQKIEKRLLSKNFSIIAYSVPTILYPHYLNINKEVKKNHKIFSVFGGTHPTFVPEIIEKDDSIDCICRGEGESALLELVERMSQGAPLRNIHNLWVREDGCIYKNPLRSLIQDLDSLPFPDRELFPYNETFYKGKMHVITSRGCPYSCTYCSNPAYIRLYNGQTEFIRKRSVKNVIEEIERVKRKISLKLVMLEDDLFTLFPDWTEEFCEQYEEKIGVPFFCYVRPDFINPSLLKSLKKAGCVSISMGVETANDYLRNTVLKRGVSTDIIINAAKIIKKENIKLETMNIIGIPKGSLDVDFETIKLNIRCNVDYSSVKMLMPYPGTEILDFAQKKGLLQEHSLTSFQSSLLFNSSTEKRATENLLKLFSITVEFPFLLPLVKKLIYLPLGQLYTIINLTWEGYTSFFRLYPTGWKGFRFGIKKYIKIFRNNLNFRNNKKIV